MIVMKKVLVCTDFSDPSRKALEYGRDLARTFGASLRVLHVVESVRAGYALDAGYVGFPELQKQMEDAAREELSAIVTDDDRRTLKAQATIVSSPSASRAIVDYAKDEGIDLIVVGTHGRGGMSRMLLGSVAERIVRTAPCPVLTVHMEERDILAPDALTVVAKA
jgi:nucleotide-binding universal stress UspA family protein